MSGFLQIIAICIAVIATVQADTSKSPNDQCVAAGYAGACVEAPERGIFPTRCSNLMCARALRNGTYSAHGIGRALDGTFCGSRLKCLQGQCTQRSTRTVERGDAMGFVCSGMPNRSSEQREARLPPIYYPRTA